MKFLTTAYILLVSWTLNHGFYTCHGFTIPLSQLAKNHGNIALRYNAATHLSAVNAVIQTQAEMNREEKKDEALSSSSKPKSKASARPKITLVETLGDYKAIVADEREKMVVVRFFAPWCKACQATESHFYRVASSYQDHVKFVEVPTTKDNSLLHQGLGIKKIPFSHIYYPEVGLVEERSISRKNFKSFESVLFDYMKRSCDVPLEDSE